MQFQEANQKKGAQYFVVNVVPADECAAEAAEEGEVSEPNCSKRFKTVLRPVVRLLYTRWSAAADDERVC